VWAAVEFGARNVHERSLRRAGRGRRAFSPLDLVTIAIGEGTPAVPADRHGYTDTGFVLAGLLVEHVTG
jgi:hypothetical protein